LAPCRKVSLEIPPPLSTMTLPKTKLVEARFRKLALVVINLGVLALVAAFLLGTVSIFTTRNVPPTVSGVTFDPQRMPYIILVSEQRGQRQKIANRMSIPFGIDPTWNKGFESVDGSEPHATSLDEGRVVFFNLTMLLPKFGIFGPIGHSQVRALQKPSMRLSYQMDHRGEIIDIMAASDDVPPEEVIKDGKLQQQHLMLLDRQCIGSGRPHVCKRLDIGLRKSILPKPGIFIGYPFEDDHTQVKYHADVDVHWQPCANEGPAFFVFTVISETVTAVKPLSMREQFQALLSRIGGYSALMSTGFFTFFVNKYPESEVEEVSHMLTLPGFKKDKRPERAPLLDL